MRGGDTEYFFRKEVTDKDVNKDEKNKQKAENEKVKKEKPKGPKKLKFTYKEQKDYETIESEITLLENKLEELDKKMMDIFRGAGCKDSGAVEQIVFGKSRKK